MNNGSLEMVQEFSLNQKFYLKFKRFFDLCVSVIGLIILVPTIIIVKIIYLLSGDTHTIFFSQNRIGQDGKEFKLYKFRTMVVNADAVLEELLKSDPEIAAIYKINKKIPNDPRNTKVGRILRKLSIDELPQMINIFLGDMSLIGNRPYLPREKADMGEYYQEIIKTKPGLSGLWQTSGRSNTTFRKRCILEAKYSNNVSFSLDCKLFFKTFLVIFKGL